MILLTACLASALAAIHLFVRRLRFLTNIPRSIWLSGAGGVAVAYVFLHILPDLPRIRKPSQGAWDFGPKWRKSRFSRSVSPD
jgi:hypothetical protein